MDGLVNIFVVLLVLTIISAVILKFKDFFFMRVSIWLPLAIITLFINPWIAAGFIFLWILDRKKCSGAICPNCNRCSEKFSEKKLIKQHYQHETATGKPNLRYKYNPLISHYEYIYQCPNKKCNKQFNLVREEMEELAAGELPKEVFENAQKGIYSNEIKKRIIADGYTFVSDKLVRKNSTDEEYRVAVTESGVYLLDNGKIESEYELVL